MKVLSFVIQQDESVAYFFEWLAETQRRIINKEIGVIFKSIKHFRRDNLFILYIDLVIPNLLPGFFFKSLLRKALRKKGAVNIKFISYKEALIFLCGG